MAQLTLEIGPLSSITTATNDNAERILASAFALYHEEPDTYSDQEKLDYVVQELIPLLLSDRARHFEEKEAYADTRDDLLGDLPVFE